METKYTGKLFTVEMFAILLGLVFLVPFYYVVSNSLKTFSEILTKTSSLPSAFQFQNYANAFVQMDYLKVFTNSLLITVASNVVIVVFCSMAAYMLVRTKSKLSNIIFMTFVAAMVIPFQSIMIPLIKVAGNLGLINSIGGLVFMYLGFGSGMAIFLYHGFIKGIPVELEEAAVIDGCTTLGLFWRIVFPLLKPITVTVIILNSLWIWNDFLLPLLVLQDPGLRTIPLATFFFFGQYMKQWDLALAALVISIIPLLIFFFAMQKHIVKGITGGAIK
jgi:raffinose/stachyose/melibiose transport system permease protein